MFRYAPIITCCPEFIQITRRWRTTTLLMLMCLRNAFIIIWFLAKKLGILFRCLQLLCLTPMPGTDTSFYHRTSLPTGTHMERQRRSPRSGTLRFRHLSTFTWDRMATTYGDYQARRKPKLGGVHNSSQHYIHVHTFHSSCRCSYFFIV